MLARALCSVLTCATLVFLSACGRSDPGFTLEPFKSCDKLEKSIKDQAITEIRWRYAWGGGGYGWGGFGFNNYDMMVSSDDMGVATPSAANLESGASSHSETNTQEADVDEADLVKTDGSYLYSIAGDHLVISRAWPTDVDDGTQGWTPDWSSVGEVSRLFIEGVPDGLYLLDDSTLIVISQLGATDGEPLAGGTVENSEYQWSNRGLVKVTIVDASDAEVPVVLRETYTPGMLYTTRMVSGRLYTVTYTILGLESVGQSDSKSESIGLVKDSVLGDWMPSRFDHMRAGPEADWSVDQAPVCDCESVYGSERESGDWLVSVQTLDTSDLTAAFHGSSVLTSVDTVYASTDSLYVVSSESTDEQSPWQSYDNSVDTFVHKFDITDGPANPSYLASGEVPGWVLNQFSLDESEGRLRIATTTSGWEGGSGESGIYVLEPGDGELVVVGSVEGLGVGEQIYAVRFVEDAAYVVTFQQIDPLYTVDLSDPENPQTRGELKIPGFSNYLHMVDDSHVLGIGQDIAENGWESFGVQISLFDVSDLDNPTRTAKLTLDDTSWSEAQSQHHAFNYFGAAQALVVPATSNSTGESRMHVVHVNPDEPLAELGTISQDDLLDSSQSEDWYYSYCTGFRRSVIMGEPEKDTPYYVYAQSNVGIVVSDVEEPDALLASVEFTGIDPCAGGSYYSGW